MEVLELEMSVLLMLSSQIISNKVEGGRVSALLMLQSRWNVSPAIGTPPTAESTTLSGGNAAERKDKGVCSNRINSRWYF